VHIHEGDKARSPAPQARVQQIILLRTCTGVQQIILLRTCTGKRMCTGTHTLPKSQTKHASQNAGKNFLVSTTSCFRHSRTAVHSGVLAVQAEKLTGVLQKGLTHLTHPSRRAAACTHCCVLAQRKRAYGVWLTTAVATTYCAPVRLGQAQLTSRVPRCGCATACGAGAHNRGVCCYLCTRLRTCRCWAQLLHTACLPVLGKQRAEGAHGVVLRRLARQLVEVVQELMLWRTAAVCCYAQRPMLLLAGHSRRKQTRCEKRGTRCARAQLSRAIATAGQCM